MSIFTIDSTLYRPLAAGLAASIAIHLWFLLSLSLEPDVAKINPIIVDIVMPEPQPQKELSQIVAPPKEMPISAPDPSRHIYLSERDAAAKQNQIKRGDYPEAGISAGKGAPVSPPSQAAPPLSDLKYLTLDDHSLTRTLKESEEAENLAAKAAKRNALNTNSSITDLSAYEAFSRPSGSGAAFIGTPGSTDYLPNLPDGDITLLNTKANKFAVFVRRVATQVFSELRRAGWETLSGADIASMGGYSTVRAVLSREGKLLTAQLESSSGSFRFDDVVTAAAKKGARDPNPPPDALAADGNFHFIFKAKSWVRGAGDRRQGSYLERRWLLLATGLE